MRFKRTIVSGLLVSMLIPAAFAGDRPSTVMPEPSRLKKFMPKLHEEKLAEARAGNIDFVMIGDSITHGWSRHPGVLKVEKMLNLGFPGDRTQNVLWRLQHGAVDGISPRLVTLMIGTNHAHEPKKGYTPDTPEDIITGIEAVVAELRTRLPEAKIIVFSVFPRKPGGANDRVNAVNAMLPRIADGRHVFHADINQTFLNDQGSYNAPLYSRDGLHLNAAGYVAWAKALQPLLEKEGLKTASNVPVARAEPLVPKLAGSRPNIILVMTDDQGMGDLSCMGNPILKTPHLDKFHELSTRFREFHVSPTCAPTRAAIFSGRHEFRNGVTHTIHERDRMALSTTTFPKLLAKNGYETGIFGKWHLGDEDEYQPYNRGFTEVFIHGAGGIGQSYKGSCGDFPPNQGPGKYFDNVLLHNDTIVQTKGFCTDVFFQAALGWIKKQHESKTPYFAYISPNAPHGPMIAPEKYKKRWLDAGWDQNTAGRYGMIENIDDNFGLLMQKLDEWDAWENTLVIFMTDNGQAGRGGKKDGKPQKMFMAGFKSGKCSAFEGGSHVPAFWRWKGVLREGVDINALCAHIDFYKTFCELAGVAIPDGIQKIDGRSMLPLLENADAAWADRELFTHVGRWKKDEDPNHSRDKSWAVRTQKWRLVGDELYNIEKDPFETTSVAAEHPEVMQRLRESYLNWWEETVPFMVNEDQPYPDVNPQAVRYEKQLKERGIPDWVAPEL